MDGNVDRVYILAGTFHWELALSNNGFVSELTIAKRGIPNGVQWFDGF